MKKLTPEEKFFYQHAGFSYDPKKETKAQGKRRCAIALARAEKYAKNHNWMYEWGNDIHDDGFKENIPETCEYCVLYNEDGEQISSLGCIDDADNNYRRVIEAELALEASHA